MIKKLFTLGVASLLWLNALAQSDSLSWEEQLALLEADLDSLSIFSLIDSILLSEQQPISSLYARVSYNSSVLNAGRTYDLNQQSFSPGISYYHASGFFMDYSGFWNSSTTPRFNLSMLSVGYMANLKNGFTITPSYERWIYHQSDASNTLNNSLGTSFAYNKKWLFLTADYSLLFGTETAHRIIGGVSCYLHLKKKWIFDRISLMPSATIYLGSDKVTQYRFAETQRSQQLLSLTQLTSEDIARLYREGKITRQEARRMERTRRLITSENLTEEQQARLTDLLYDVRESKTFGLMNYSFSLPVSFTINNFSWMISYTYSVPVSLPGEQITLEPLGYLGASVSYLIPFKHK